MRPHNRDGVAVDPVPFVVVFGLAALMLLSFGPLYGQAIGVSLSAALSASAGLTVVAAVIAYYRHIWTAQPAVNRGSSVRLRAERLFELMIILAVVFVGLAIPLVV